MNTAISFGNDGILNKASSLVEIIAIHLIPVVKNKPAQIYSAA
jgi:hypothetical protein